MWLFCHTLRASPLVSSLETQVSASSTGVIHKGSQGLPMSAYGICQAYQESLKCDPYIYMTDTFATKTTKYFHIFINAENIFRKYIKISNKVVQW